MEFSASQMVREKVPENAEWLSNALGSEDLKLFQVQDFYLDFRAKILRNQFLNYFEIFCS